MASVTYKAPSAVLRKDHLQLFSVFLGGSIEKGKAEEWQDKITKDLEKYDLLILNPRREGWDSSWTEDKDSPQFREQVEWELFYQEYADLCIYYFAADTISPITLLELGKFSYKPSIVYCDDAYSRKGNLEIFCERYDKFCTNNYDKFIKQLIREKKKKYGS